MSFVSGFDRAGIFAGMGRTELYRLIDLTLLGVPVVAIGLTWVTLWVWRRYWPRSSRNVLLRILHAWATLNLGTLLGLAMHTALELWVLYPGNSGQADFAWETLSMTAMAWAALLVIPAMGTGIYAGVRGHADIRRSADQNACEQTQRCSLP